ncbi:MAG: sigma-54 dependent transcriptional regulator [Calditrichia bacterium]
MSIRQFSQNRNPADHDVRLVQTDLKKQAVLNLLKGNSPRLQEIKAKIIKIAGYDVSVLINGETGSGKELCAQTIHFLSQRADKPFVPLNCGGIPGDLFENELFGHKRGAYTTANSSERGLIAAAEGGTLFLDEVESLPEPMQVKLLRFLQEKRYKPLGQSAYLTADVRIIAAAKENLQEHVNREKFRKDLFYRLGVVRISLPPLRERTDDIPGLVYHLIEKYSALYQTPVKNVTPAAMLRMIHHNWPGNVRELENIIQEAMITSPGGTIGIDDLHLEPPSNGSPLKDASLQTSKKKTLETFEVNYLKSALRMFNGNVSKAARYAHKERSAFFRLLKKYNIDPTAFRPSR